MPQHFIIQKTNKYLIYLYKLNYIAKTLNFIHPF